jgi:hypothetical protein
MLSIQWKVLSILVVSVFIPSFLNGSEPDIPDVRSGGSLPDPESPHIDYSTFFGGSGSDGAVAVEIDEKGGLIIVGWTNSSDLSTTSGAFDPTYNGGKDVFVLRIGNDSRIENLTYIGGSKDDVPTGMSISPGGGIAICGYTGSDDLPEGEVHLNASNRPGLDAFVFLLSGDISHLNFSGFIGGSSEDHATDIDVGEDGSIYATGYTKSADFPVTHDCFDEFYNYTDGFVTRIDPLNGSLIYSTYIGGSGYDVSNAIDVNEEGYALIGGDTCSNDYPITPGVFVNNVDYMDDPCITSLDPSGAKLAFSTVVGGYKWDWVNDVSWSSEYLLVGGFSASYSQFPITEDAFDRVGKGGGMSDGADGFIMKLNLNSSQLLYSSFFGEDGIPSDWVKKISVDMQGYCYMLGISENKIMIGKTDFTNEIRYFTKFGMTTTSYDMDIALGHNGICWIVGGTESSGFPVTTDGEDRIFNGASDAFIMRLSTPIPPSAPKELEAVAGDGFVDIEWKPPENDGLSYIEGYNLYRLNISSGEETRYSLGSYVNELKDTEVMNGIEYSYRVSAVNHVGEGLSTDPVTAMPGYKPSSPRGLQVIPYSHSVSLLWYPPEDDGCVGIDGYVLHKRERNGKPMTIQLDTDTEYVDLDVINGKYYEFSVSARNRFGEGERTEPIWVRIPNLPGKVTSPSATAGWQFVDLSWDPPEDDGGSPITSYMIQRRKVMEEGNITAFTTEECSFRDNYLQKGVEMEYTIKAVNSVGEGPFVQWMRATPFGTPDPPRIIEVTGSDGLVTIKWDPPVNDGGKSIEGYIIYRSTWGEPEDGESEYEEFAIGLLTEFLDVSVKNGYAYEYRMRAVNAVGTGSSTEEYRVVPFGPPDAWGIRAIPGDKNVTLEWGTHWYDNGAEIDSFRIYRSSDGKEVLLKTITREEVGGIVTIDKGNGGVIPPNFFTYLDSGLSNGVHYTYWISAVNSLYEGDRAGPVIAVPYGQAGPPIGFRIVEGPNTLILSWSPPADDGGSPVTGYWIFIGNESGMLSHRAEVSLTTAFSDSHLVNGKVFFYAVAAITAWGEGERSPIVSGSPGAKPSPPLGMNVIISEGRALLAWSHVIDDGGRPILGYDIYRCGKNGTFARIATLVQGTSFTDAEIPGPGSYSYRVSAENAMGESDWSEPAVAKFPAKDGERSVPFWVPILIVLALVAIILVLSFVGTRKRKDLRAWKTFSMDEVKRVPRRSSSQPSRDRPSPPRERGRT